ncbi:NADH-quinone oxidoreductase subunit NuoN [Aestuariivirga sp.]|uniref:NADH-quinone oxidoreductase subunit NuoN n=1 Tax=Aestuariivirga sp. TaxID=2650926 RepID=UPI0025C62304|nr:NADH-quinone oxidoreductase subunit NuoN [Aestuariivirga sp.]MCA3554217.1 NADH-quinone oxidoreductase subunit NuoN [Aestuariivirga sp.]
MWLLQQADAVAALPEIVLAVLTLALLMLGVFRKGDPSDTVTLGALIALGITALLVIFAADHQDTAFHGALMVDTFARVMKVLALFGSAAALALSVSFMKRDGSQRFEYPVLILLAALGMMLMISANSLIALYMGLELQSLSLYVLAAINRDSARASEAGLKYFVLGALSSGMLLYGASLIYGFTGTTGFPGIAAYLTNSGADLGAIFGLVFVIAGLAFKISAVPFHMWTPDVYEGAPTPVTAFFAAAPKVAAMALITRTMMAPFGAIYPAWGQIIIFVSIASMSLGAFAAIGQTNIKRLLAYSSIANMGYALVGLAAGTQEGVQGVVVYMIIYMIMTLGSFACILSMRRKGHMVEEIADLAGLSRNNKGLAFVFAILMFSMAGIPPLAGFFAKYFVFLAAVKAGLYALAVIGVVTSVVGAYYYLRIVKIMYFDEPKEAFEPMDGEVKLIAYASGAFTIAFVLPWIASPVIAVAAAAARSFY